MKVTGKRRWLILALVSLVSGVMVYVPFLRYSYYDQMVLLFTQFKPIVSQSYVHEFIGDIGLAFGVVSMLAYPIGGILADKFSEKYLLIIGAVIMGISSFWYGVVLNSTAMLIIHVLYGVGTSVFIWSAYLKIVRKMGTGEEQGKMYSTSEFTRAILGMIIGFLGVSLLNKAVYFALGTYGYTICGGVLIPMFIMGLIMRDRESDEFKSKMDIRSARIGITVGVVLALAFELIPSWKAVFGGGVIPAIVGTVLGIVIPNFFYRKLTIK